MCIVGHDQPYLPGAEAPPASALINLIVTFFVIRHFFRSSMTFLGIYLGQ